MFSRCSICFEIKDIVFSKPITGKAGQYNYCKDCNPNARNVRSPNQNKPKGQKNTAIRGDPTNTQALILPDPEANEVGMNERLKLFQLKHNQTFSEEQPESCKSEEVTDPALK